ncbi:MAG: sulfotransferase, partial [Bacteroidota bacterium]
MKRQFEQLTKKWGFYPWIEPIYNFPSVVRGAYLYYSRSRKEFVIIASAMRSGSTLLKALLAQAPEIEQLSEQRFQLPQNFFTVYGRLASLSEQPIIVLKHPANFNDFRTYPILPKVPFKMIILVRNPVDTIFSIQTMQEKRNDPKPLHEIIEYWKIVHRHLLKLEGPDFFRLRYADLVGQPETWTKELFQFIGSSQEEGVSSYQSPERSNWEWGKDDGGEVIKKLAVQKVEKDYSGHQEILDLVYQDSELLSLAAAFELELPGK